MTDEKLQPNSDIPPLHLAENAERAELAGRLADVMQTELERRLAEPDTETHEIIAKVSKESDSRLGLDNLGPVVDAMRRRDSKS